MERREGKRAVREEELKAMKDQGETDWGVGGTKESKKLQERPINKVKKGGYVG